MSAWRRQRGAAMAEMVIMAPVMIAMWIGVDYFRSGYSRRLDAMAQAQSDAWKLASSNDGSCFSNRESWEGFQGATDATDPANTTDKGAQAATQFSNNTASSMFMYAHASVTATKQSRAAHFDGDRVASLKAGMYITCNEVVPPTNAAAAVGSNGDGNNQFADQDVLKPVIEFVKSMF